MHIAAHHHSGNNSPELRTHKRKEQGHTFLNEASIGRLQIGVQVQGHLGNDDCLPSFLLAGRQVLKLIRVLQAASRDTPQPSTDGSVSLRQRHNDGVHPPKGGS